MKNFAVIVLTPLVASAALSVAPIEAAELSITTMNSDGQPIPTRVHLTDSQSKSILTTKERLPSFQNHITSPGEATFDLAPGSYSITVEHGPEWTSESRQVDVGGESKQISIALQRIADLANEGWWSGEMHIHRSIDDAELLMRAEDLHFGQFLSWWNRNNPWLDNPLPAQTTITFDSNRAAHLVGGEDERDGGALLFFNLEKPIDITAGRQHYPSSLDYAKQVKAAGGWIDIEKPFWWDVPMWIANGIGDSIGIANNHHYRHGMLPSEAWGRPRDVERLPPPQGNGWWTQEIYHHLLNCGIRIPPSAGSASGVLPNPVGYNRAYVKIDGKPTMEKWFAGLKAGRVFVSNGPLLRVTANGQLPGHVFKSDQNSMFIELRGQLDGNDPIDRVEVVHNGRVISNEFPGWFPVHESGWFLVRAITPKTNTLRFASTAPFYIELEGNKTAPQQHESAQFFVTWCKERMANLQANNELTAAQKTEVLKPWRDALAFWQTKENDASARQTVRGEVIDSDTKKPIPARIYIKDTRGGWHFVESTSHGGAAVRYEKRNWFKSDSEEFHTTVSAHPFEARLTPGRYELVVERGKEYFAVTNSITVSDEPISLTIPLKRWINMAERSWFSGDTHVHRTLQDLPNAMLAEDLNVAFPLTYWVTHAFRPPTSGDKSSKETIPGDLIEVDDTHVIWPRNTEWEIFSVKQKRHTLGAVFALGHDEPFELGVPTVKNVAEAATEQGALLDLDKHDWPWSMTLPPNMGVHLYELANNHIWRTQFAFTNWSSPTPEHLRPPLREQSGNEREWIQFTMANYYALLNCGVNMVPTGGTASGVHPVPLGFGRVYVHQPDGFSYEKWKTGLEAGRSFVTTGPMMFIKVNDRDPGEHFAAEKTFTATIKGEIISDRPVVFTEIIHDGQPVKTIMGTSGRTKAGAHVRSFQAKVTFSETGWLAVRCWEDREGDRVRYAHTAPWHVSIGGEPIKAPKADREYLIDRVNLEIERSNGVLPKVAIDEYKDALKYYKTVKIRKDNDKTARGDSSNPTQWMGSKNRVRVVPYPGGRHPRMGFLDGAIDPQSETKFTAFTPWDPSSYVVVDVPEAIWSNLGLTYLAHTHIDTIWDNQNIELPELEWKLNDDDSLTHERILANGIAFGAKVIPHEHSVEMVLWLKNGTSEKLTDLRIQNCVMLKGAAGFNAQSNWNKRLEKPYAVAHNEEANRWIITAWEHCDRPWANPPVPCIHSDPKFPDLKPDETGRLKGWLWFYEGDDIEAELARLTKRFPDK